MLDGLSATPAEDPHLTFHQYGIRNDNRVPVARLDGRMAPPDVPDSALHVAAVYPVAFGDGLLHLEREASNDVAQGILKREADHCSEDRGRRDEARETHPAAL